MRKACVATALALAACQPLPHPFADDRPSAALIAVPDNFDIAVAPVAGEPHATAAKLSSAIAGELLKHNIPASDATTSRASYRLEGRIDERPDPQPGKSLLTVHWRLHDPRGRIVSERSDHLAAPTRDWREGSDESIGRLAAAGAAAFAALMSDETPKEAPGGGRIRVAVRGVAGAPGDGDGALASSLVAVLKHHDIELVDAARGKPDVAVDGEVRLEPTKEGKQHVKIVWHVAHAAGGEIGQVAQENDVPRGRLDGAWGDVAYSVAMAADQGIMQLVERGAPPQKQAVGSTAAAPPASATAATPGSISAAAAAPATPTVAGNLDSPEVNLPPVNVGPADMPQPLGPPPDAPVHIPYRGVPILH